MTTSKRKTALLHGRRVYADSLVVKELSAGGAAIVYGDGVSSFVDDWDRDETPATVVVLPGKPK